MRHLFLIFILFYISGSAISQEVCLSGRVMDGDEPLPNATVWIMEWRQGTVADSAGNWRVCGPPAATLQVRVSYLGFTVVSIRTTGTSSLKMQDIFLEKDPFQLDQIVVSASNTGRTRGKEPQALQVIDLEDFNSTGSSTLAEGLCYQTGLRVESNCQTCQFTQVRLNGLTGSYTQLLLDGRPVFNALLTMYGLEQFPVSLLDRVEIIRGGGPVALGARAIGGTINLITSRPDQNGMEGNLRYTLIGGKSVDLMADASASFTSSDKKYGNGIYVALRDREGWDANRDGFTEIPELKATSVGWVGFWDISKSHSLDAKFWNIREFRRGGNKLDLPPHESDQAEERDHHIHIGSLRHRWSIGQYIDLENFVAAQYTSRNHYTGAFGSPGWGSTISSNLIIGSKGSLEWERNTLIFGGDHSRENTVDEIPGYGFLLDQSVRETGLYAQDIWDINDRWTLDAGMRLNFHNRLSEPVFTPRVNLLYRAGDNQLRAGWSRGFKGPQAFESDLHISFSGGGVARVAIDPDLTRELSDGWYISVDRQWGAGSSLWFASIQMFANDLRSNFILQNAGRDSLGNLILFRTNGEGAVVYGLSAECSWRWGDIFQWENGWTWQQARHREPVQWSDGEIGTDRFLRTPDHYGFSKIDLYPASGFTSSLSAVFTGPMWVPHLAGAPGVDEDRLVRTPFLADIQISVSRSWSFSEDRSNLTLQLGMRNVLNTFQKDLDTGPNRDSNFVYGPFLPRSIFLNLRWKSAS